MPVIRKFEGQNRKFIIANARVENCAIIFCNDAFCSMCGYTRGEVMQKSCTCSFLYGPGTRRPAMAQMAKALLGAEERKVEMILYTKEGECFQCSIDVVPVKNEDGLVIMFILNFDLPTDPKPSSPSPARELNNVLHIPWLAQVRKGHLRLLLRSLGSGGGPQSEESPAPGPPGGGAALGPPGGGAALGARLPPLGHESVVLEKLLSLPESRRLQEGASGLLLWDQEEEAAWGGGRGQAGGRDPRGPRPAPPTAPGPRGFYGFSARGEPEEEGGEDCAFGDSPPAGRPENGASSVKHSSSVDDLKKRRSFCERRLQMRHSCTGIGSSRMPAGTSDQDLVQQLTQSLLEPKTDSYVALHSGERDILAPCKLMDRTHNVTEKVTQVSGDTRGVKG
ncbi:potassium voltage-gated channel subfamily H member 2-like [Gadus macrocephalus]|uniref:potassium voltage-gated channel subfamily H member 2-like n=1 Tax=Gadus macrocephalus TaxID=80720 RepID=UPI0028CBB3F5|nr:potassium voltage-gated channel subfamily H member 2-like [Gadus macrocephalus]